MNLNRLLDSTHKPKDELSICKLRIISRFVVAMLLVEALAKSGSLSLSGSGSRWYQAVKSQTFIAFQSAMLHGFMKAESRQRKGELDRIAAMLTTYLKIMIGPLAWDWTDRKWSIQVLFEQFEPLCYATRRNQIILRQLVFDQDGRGYSLKEGFGEYGYTEFDPDPDPDFDKIQPELYFP